MGKDTASLVRIERLGKLLTTHSDMASKLAVKLRLTQSSRYNNWYADAQAKSAPASADIAPWQNWGDRDDVVRTAKRGDNGGEDRSLD